MLVTLEKPTESPAYNGQRLAKKLLAYRNSQSVIAVATPEAKAIAAILASELELPCDQHYCKVVRHPGNPHKTIGSLTAGNVVLDNSTFTMPRDYIQHQIVMLQHSLYAHPEDAHDPNSTRDRNVIVLREEVTNPDELMAIIDQLWKEEAAAVIIATPVISRETLSQIERQVTDVVYLDIRHHSGLWLNPVSG